jgi:hypothetical protein
MIEEIKIPKNIDFKKMIPFLGVGIVVLIVFLKKSGGNSSPSYSSDSETVSQLDYTEQLDGIQSANTEKYNDLKNSYDTKFEQLSEKITQSDLALYDSIQTQKETMREQSEQSISLLTQQIEKNQQQQQTQFDSLKNTFSGMIDSVVSKVSAGQAKPQAVETVKEVKQETPKKKSSNNTTVTTTSGKTRELDSVSKNGYKTTQSKDGGYYYDGIYFDN